MKGRKRLTADERRRQISVAVVPVFARKGFDGATSRELAEAAGVSEALIYKYFPTKESLYDGLIDVFGQGKERLTGLIDRLEPGTESLVLVLYSIARLILVGPPGRPQNGHVDRLVGQSLLGDGRFAEAFLQDVFEPVVPFLRQCLDAAWEQGDLVGERPSDSLDCTLFHHAIGASALFRLSPKPMFPTDDTETLFRRTLLFALRGMGLTPAAIDHHLGFDRLQRSFDSTFTRPPHETS